MATLHLIRHGQASFGAENYDQLSKTGQQQGRVLGQWLAGQTRPGAVFCGSLKRHEQTLAAMAEGFGADWSGITATEAGMNEFDHLPVIQAYNPAWADRKVMAKDLAAASHPGKAFQKAFVKAVERWVAGDHDSDYPETWQAFKARVHKGLDRITTDAAGAQHVFVVTSGGPIMVAMQQLLGLSDRRALGLNEVLANASVSRVLFSGDRRSLAVFNNFAHLEAADPALVTYR